jgi:hypothetical protein
VRLASAILVAAALASVAGLILDTQEWRMFGLSALVFGSAALVGFSNAWGKDVVSLSVTEKGIELPASKLIRWDEVDEITYTDSDESGTWLRVWTRDPFVVARRGPIWHWTFAVFNRLLGFPPLSLCFPTPVEELSAEIELLRATGLTPDEVRGGPGSVTTGDEGEQLVFTTRPVSEGGVRRGTRATR